MNRTGIQYLDFSWNPLAMRCTPMSAGCANCWHLRMCKRHAANPKLSREMRDARAGGPPALLFDELEAPLKRKKPARIGVQFMGDLFHEDVSDTDVLAVMSTIQDCPQHTFLILTKRPKRMREFFEWFYSYPWEQLDDPPLMNLWLGVSVENQKAADERIPILLQTPAAVRWVSVEPMLEEIELHNYFPVTIDWIIAGAESGPGARPCKLEWVRSLKNQCVEAGVPFFYKQGPTDFGDVRRINGGNVDMPVLDGQRWEELPGSPGGKMEN